MGLIIDLIWFVIKWVWWSWRHRCVCTVASDEQVEEAKVYIERNVMSHIYVHAMYPNGDGDMARDQYV